MSITENTSKLEQFNEFFSIEHKFSVNLNPIEQHQMPSFEHFVNQIPLPFRLSSDMVSIDQAALKPIQALSGVAGQLVDYLNHQSHKIDLLVGYILSQQDEQGCRFEGVRFGGGGIVFNAQTPFELGQMLEMKVFFLEENCAVYCIGEVIEVTEHTNEETAQPSHQHKTIFHYLREEDREVLVRTSLHLQSKHLQTLAKQRNQASKDGKGQ